MCDVEVGGWRLVVGGWWWFYRDRVYLRVAKLMEAPVVRGWLTASTSLTAVLPRTRAGGMPPPGSVVCSTSSSSPTPTPSPSPSSASFPPSAPATSTLETASILWEGIMAAVKALYEPVAGNALHTNFEYVLYLSMIWQCDLAIKLSRLTGPALTTCSIFAC